VTPRLTATLSLVLGIGLLMAFFWWASEGPLASAQARHLREMKGRHDAPANFASFTFDSFAALPHARPLAEYAPIERRGASLVGYARWMHSSMDGDYHLNLAPIPAPLSDQKVMPVTGEITPSWRRGSNRWRWERLAAEMRPHEWGVPDWPQPPRLVRLSGWLMYDFEYDAPYGHPRKALPGSSLSRRLTGWEIHPVTRIELWDDSLRRFVEYPR
jgi:hypothetical protein